MSRARPLGRRPPRAGGDKHAPAPGAGALGLTVFLVSLGVLFAAALVAYAVIRLRAETWRVEGQHLPRGVWVSTLLLAGCSVALQRALAGVRGGRADRLFADLLLGGALALSFVASQLWNWVSFYAWDVLYRGSLYGFTFYMLTGLHALHVIGGLAALGWVAARARRGAYTWAHHAGVRHTAVYWHFLGAVWLVLLGVLLAG
jgi:cytochrome c oxidase subunit 3